MKILLYRPQGRYCPIEAIYMTARGNPGHVRAEDQRMDVVNEFFRRNPDYGFVKFHTHSQGTIRIFGEQFATHFSEGDLRSYEEQLRTNPEFIGMVVTPETKLLYAPDNPTIRVVSGFPSEANERIHRELEEIKRAFGYDFPSLTATRRGH
ncbi:hypothetical protein HYX08_06470 [Candidatus Woesearchaeota archaeon]|nr:hypothetical protein [Candidatus Woesearchaeota archaeon]